MLTRSRVSMVIFTKFLYAVGLQGEPPFLSFLDCVQFQSPPTIRVVISDLSIKRILFLNETYLLCVDVGRVYITK